MKKVELTTETGSGAEMIGNFWRIEAKLNEMVEWSNEISKWIGQVDKDWVKVQKWIKEHEKLGRPGYEKW